MKLGDVLDKLAGIPELETLRAHLAECKECTVGFDGIGYCATAKRMAIMGAAPAVLGRLFAAAAESVTRSCPHEIAINGVCVRCKTQLNPLARR